MNEMDLCDQVTGCPARKRETSSVSSPRCTSNTALKLTYLLRPENDLLMYTDQVTVKTTRGATRNESTKDLFKTKFPDMKMRKMTTPHIKRVKVIDQACPWDSYGL